jgi:hypothetical protein
MRLTVGASAVLVVTLLGACSDGPSAAPGTPASPSSQRSASAGQIRSAGGGPVAPSTPAEATLRLQSLLGQHAILAADMMRARIGNDSDLAQAANAALGSNTQALAGLLKPVIGDPATEQFTTLWGKHVESLFTYARALSTKDDAGRRQIRSTLVGYEDQLAAFFTVESKGRLDRAAAMDAVRMHVDHLLDGADVYAAHNDAAAASLYRVSYSHTFDLGGTLARALLPADVSRQLDTPGLKLRTALTKLLGEHVALVVAAMRSTARDDHDSTALGDAVNANTLELTGAIDSLYGRKAARGFQSLWADHCDELMAYTMAAAGGDAAGREQARLKLRVFEQAMGSFLDTATQNRLGRPALVQTLVLHDRTLLAEIDAYSAKNFQEAHDLSYRTYQDMFSVAHQLADAIGATLAGRLPTGGSQTGGGGMAKVVEGR